MLAPHTDTPLAKERLFLKYWGNILMVGPYTQHVPRPAITNKDKAVIF